MTKHRSEGGEKLQTDRWHQWAILNTSQKYFPEKNLDKFPITHEDKFYPLYVYAEVTVFLA